MKNFITIDRKYWYDYVLPLLCSMNKDVLEEELKNLPIETKSKMVLPTYFWNEFQHACMNLPDIEKHIRYPVILPYEKRNIESNAPPLRDYQKGGAEFLKHMFEKNGYVRGVFQASTGYGKTRIISELIKTVSFKTAILVHNSVLFNQMIEALSKYGFKNIGAIQGSDSFEKNLDKDICVMMVQTIISIYKKEGFEYISSKLKDFGLLIADEVHILGAAQGFSKASMLFETINKVGFSATPYRNGIHKILLHCCSGPIVYKSNYKNYIPEINIIKTDYKINPNGWPQKRIKLMDNFTFKSQAYNKYLAEHNDQHFALITDTIKSLLSEGRTIGVIFSHNIAIDKLIYYLSKNGVHDVCAFYDDEDKILIEKYLNVLKEKNIDTFKCFHEPFDLSSSDQKKKYLNILIEKSGIKSNKKLISEKILDIENKMKEKNIFKEEYKYKKINSNKKKIELLIKEIEKNNLSLPLIGSSGLSKHPRVICGNSQKLSTGFDNESIDTFIFGSLYIGKVSATQIIGRALRYKEDKKRPKIFFPIDKFYIDNIFPPIVAVLLKNIKSEFGSNIVEKISYK